MISFANFNYLKNNAGSGDEYEKLVANINVANKNNKAVGFTLAKRIDLMGEDIMWNYGGAYFYSTYADMMESRAETNPPNADQPKLASLRTIKRSEVLYNKYSLRKKTN